jgi:hypothetical protein
MRALPMRTLLRSSVVVCALSAAASTGFAQTGATTGAPEKPGRYVMSPIEGGFARLDTETGLMSVCKGKADNFKCDLAQDSTAAAQKEAEKNTAEAKELRAEIKRLEDMLGLGDKPGDGSSNKQAEQRPGSRPGGSGGPGFKLPSEAEVDDALDYITKMVKKFKSKLKELESDGKGSSL